MDVFFFFPQRKFNSNTYTIDVEVGWGEEDREVFLYQKVHTLSCSYDAHGDAGSSVELIADWWVTEAQKYKCAQHFSYEMCCGSEYYSNKGKGKKIQPIFV